MAATNKIKLICVGKVKEAYLKEGVADFSKRISHYAKLDVVEIKDLGMEQEAEKILSHLRSDDYTIALCVDGKQYSSMELAKLIMATPKNMTFIIGGANGLSQKVIEKAHLKLSLSQMTFTHEMCRLFLLEQIYRAFTIIKGRPYHK
ncbi:23S rRNA (pseudouridine(1915)-N(3))-methyltransferase RlmH [Candidatus Woesearchaeota archaeon]|nr:23S rRNA (pseudouridine(1915)-N(3))-methyltransferase RlmH [Candidatus Woesearchaeota archaeon]